MTRALEFGVNLNDDVREGQSPQCEGDCPSDGATA